MTHLIDRDEVIKILNDSMRLHSTPMGELINSFFEKRINKLSTHEDRVKQLIEKKINECTHGTGPDSLYQLSILQELLNELYPNN